MLNSTSACPSQNAASVSVCQSVSRPTVKFAGIGLLSASFIRPPTLIEGMLRKNPWRSGPRTTGRTEDHIACFSEICHSLDGKISPGPQHSIRARAVAGVEGMAVRRGGGNRGARRTAPLAGIRALLSTDLQ